MTPPDHYDPKYFADIYAAGKHHFWFKYRNEVIARAAGRFWNAGAHSSRRVLEVGCGTGNVLPVLQRSCPGAHVTGMDLFVEGLQFARQHTSASLVCSRVDAMPFAVPFGLIGLFDVLEHIPDDQGALRNLRDVLSNDGALLVTVPAHQALWSLFDIASGHVRRYSVDALRTVAARSGFVTEYAAPFMFPLAPLVWLNRRRLHRSPDVDPIRRELNVPKGINAAMLALLRIEGFWLGLNGAVPVGTSILALLKKTV